MKHSPLLSVVVVTCLGGAAIGQDGQPDAPKPTSPIPATPIQPAPARTQEPTQDEYKQKLEDKLKKPVFQKAHWIFDYDEARNEARKSGKTIFAYFSRSYAP
jgi:hypothetical protein